MGALVLLFVIAIIIFDLYKKLKGKYFITWIIGTIIIYLITGIGDYFLYDGMQGVTTGYMPVYSLFFAPLIVLCFTLFVFDFNKR